MQILGPAFAFIIVIVILVFVHELGHFLAARLTGMRVDVFAVGMGRRLLGYNKITGFTFGPLPDDWEGDGVTDYRLSLFPIGGYVSIKGMVDESMDDSFSQAPPKPYEFRSKNAAQKIFVLAAGVLMNLLLALVIFAAINMMRGKEEMATTQIGWLAPESAAAQAGFVAGDEIRSIGAHPIQYWSEIMYYLALDDIGETKSVGLVRGGKDTTILVDSKIFLDAITKKSPIGFMPAASAVVLNGVETLKPAGKAGLHEGDTIISIDGISIHSTQQFISLVKERHDPPRDMLIEWKREGSMFSTVVTPDKSGTIGVLIGQIYTGTIVSQTYSFLTAISEGGKQTLNSITLIFDQLRLMLQGSIDVKDSVGGPIMIAKVASEQVSFGFLPFLVFLAQLSVMLAFMNILPLPVLDGGHILIVLIEAILRRELPTRVKMGIQQAGMVFMLVLMIAIFYLDLTR